MLTRDRSILRAKKLSDTDKKLTEKEVREEYRQHRKDKTFAQCWPANNDSFYEWCSGYLDYKHITKKNRKKNSE